MSIWLDFLFGLLEMNFRYFDCVNLISCFSYYFYFCFYFFYYLCYSLIFRLLLRALGI